MQLRTALDLCVNCGGCDNEGSLKKEGQAYDSYVYLFKYKMIGQVDDDISVIHLNCGDAPMHLRLFFVMLFIIC